MGLSSFFQIFDLTGHNSNHRIWQEAKPDTIFDTALQKLKINHLRVELSIRPEGRFNEGPTKTIMRFFTKTT
jgi:hypothetical protein